MRWVRIAAPEQWGDFVTLVREYGQMLPYSLEFQGWSQELEDPAAIYRAPGYALLAYDQSYPAGTVALKDLGHAIGEVKRLYVRPLYRGQHLGGQLLDQLMDEARTQGFRRLWLDTLPFMVSARRLYESRGFYEIPPYYDNPLPGVQYFECRL
ncbi:putative acetyltransferase [Sulfobacillus acidophilus TPY]|uniref:GCN5-related N-acetyltransferase n=1 Tax=Sulfobacillus acidophilus (strain ATCC 700253 / DSM 10332 / NAL) TaxID=679936 RepID=G8TVT5_SULAD|nr:putative acetyltransferase [Sulfobacillus acidophilus TPY]AEW04779.1 GCN5-related N-acetyltransferase [Sulfobacillus acidophilus DSM 10332]